MTAHEKDLLILHKLEKLNPSSTIQDANTLRRAALALHSWFEHECNGTIQRDEKTNIPYSHSYLDGKRYARTPDREAGTTKRIKKVCERLNLHFYIQTDPRGGTLYVDNQPIPDNNYSRSTFIA